MSFNITPTREYKVVRVMATVSFSCLAHGQHGRRKRHPHAQVLLWRTSEMQIMLHLSVQTQLVEYSVFRDVRERSKMMCCSCRGDATELAQNAYAPSSVYYKSLL